MSRSNWSFGLLGKLVGKEPLQKPEGLDKFRSEFTQPQFSMFEFLRNASKYLPAEKDVKAAVQWASESLIPRETNEWGKTIIHRDTTLADMNISELKRSHPDEAHQQILRAIIAFVVDKVLDDSQRITRETKSHMFQAAGTSEEAQLRQKLIDYLYSLDVK